MLRPTGSGSAIVFRKTLTILSLIGLLLSVGLWARSYCWIDGVLIPTTKPDHCEVVSMLGVIHVGLSYDSSEPPVKEVRYIASDAQEYHRIAQEGIQKMRDVFQNASSETGKFWRNWKPNRAFRWNNSTITARGVTYRTKAISFPHWLLVSLFSIPSFLWGVNFLRRRKRKKLGLCVKCGYDLRASKDRCPECGEAFEK